ncbi:MAG: DUF3021 domain-containing protein [Ruminococcaceae bacterium]|nr:DUF3021 domain-containing protein [Oscillospiraceae bacterium]
MKHYFLEFLRRGLLACGIGPLVLAIIYLILEAQTDLSSLTVGEVCRGIFSLTALAFLAGGMNVVYQIERLPLMAAILLHGGVLYVGYLAVYLLNGWLAGGIMPILVFTGIFAVGYVVIWILVCCITQKHTASINAKLEQKRQI